LKRNDGRAANEARRAKVTRGYLPYAEGSVLFELGETRVACSATVEDKVPGWRRGSGKGWVTAEYSMLPRATEYRTTREVTNGRPKGRTSEIQRLIGRSLRSVIELDKLGGEVQIILDCDVINADGGTRTASITGAFIALYDALAGMVAKGRIKEMPLTDFVAATSVGVINGERCLDLNYLEDSQAEVDMNVVMNSSGEIIEVQGTAEKSPFPRTALDEMLDLAQTGISDLISLQRTVLLGDKK
jgi:ribonuclease PH